MVWFLTRKPNIDGEGGLGMALADAIRLTLPQVQFLISKYSARVQLSPEEIKRQAMELYQKDPEEYKRRIKAAIDKARKLTRGKT